MSEKKQEKQKEEMKEEKRLREESMSTRRCALTHSLTQLSLSLIRNSAFPLGATA